MQRMHCKTRALLGSVLSVLLVAASSASQKKSQAAHGRSGLGPNAPAMPPPLELTNEQVIKFSIPAPVITEPGIKCDSDGNIFLASANSEQAVALMSKGRAPGWRITNSVLLRKLNLNSRSVVQYAIPPVAGYNLFRKSYSLGPDDALYMLFEATREKPSKSSDKRSRYFIDRFHSNGSFDSRVTLVGPAGESLVLDNFGVFSDGRYFLSGVSYKARGSPLRPFAAIYDANGRFMQKVDFSRSTKARYAGPVAKGAEGSTSAGLYLSMAGGGIASARDGSIYLFEASNPLVIYDISPAGTVDREARVHVPAAGLTPMEFGIAGPGLVYAEFEHIGGTVLGGHPPQGLIAIINIESGQLDRLYHLPPGASHGGMMGVCGDPQGNFLFLETSRDDKLVVAKYSAN